MVCVFICVSPRSNTGGFYFIKVPTVPQEDIVWHRNTSQNETYQSNTSHLSIILTPI